jgi:acetyl-CoA synthetase
MQPVVIGDVMWEPSPEVISKSRLKRFMDQHGIATFGELLKRADEDIEWFWDAAIKDIDIAFYRHYDKVVDLSNGKPWATWWIGGRMNIVQSCLDRYRGTESASKLAIIWEGEPGEVRKLTYRELDQQVCKLAGVLRRLGIRPGDRVGVFMPMCPEVAISVLAIAKIGAVIIPLFSGYGPEAIASMLRDA